MKRRGVQRGTFAGTRLVGDVNMWGGGAALCEKAELDESISEGTSLEVHLCLGKASADLKTSFESLDA